MESENQLSNPAIVPTLGSMLRMIVKQSFPALGMADVISAKLCIFGRDKSLIEITSLLLAAIAVMLIRKGLEQFFT